MDDPAHHRRIAGNATGVDCLGLWGVDGHGVNPVYGAVALLFMRQGQQAGKCLSVPVDPGLIAVVARASNMDIGHFGVFEDGLQPIL